MPQRLEPKFSILPAAQREIWAGLAPAQQLSFVPYDGTAIALHLGHRESLDFDFFRYEPLDKDQVRDAFGFVRGAAILQDTPDTLVVLAAMPSGLVKVSFFGGIGFGCVRRLALVPGSANRYCSPSFETATEPVIGRAFARPVGDLLQR